MNSRKITQIILSLAVVWLMVARAQAIQIPRSLDRSDRETALRILGFGTSHKIISNPYSLGGHSGLEVGITLETMAIEELSTLGAGSNGGSDLSYPKLSVGKGLFHQVDIFLALIPFTAATAVQDFSGAVRATLFEHPDLPILLSASVHGSLANFNNQILTETLGGELNAGVYLGDLSLNLSGGVVRSFGKFTGGTQGITASENQETEVVTGTHIGASAVLNFRRYFVALAADRYEANVLSAKLAYSF